MVRVFAVLLILSFVGVAEAKGPNCKRLVSAREDLVVATPKHLLETEAWVRAHPKAARTKIVKLGYSSAIAARMIANEEVVVPYLVADDLEIALPRKKSFTEAGRGWKQRLNMEKLERKQSLKPITLYRGLQIESLDEIVWENSFFRQSEFSSVGNVVFFANQIGEARHYAFPKEADAGYVLKFQIPAAFFFRLDATEGFVHPEHFRNLGSFLEGVYELKDPMPSYFRRDIDEDGHIFTAEREKRSKPIEKWIPYAKLPPEIRLRLDPSAGL